VSTTVHPPSTEEQPSSWERLRDVLAKIAGWFGKSEVPPPREVSAMGIAELVIAATSALMEAIGVWQRHRDARRVEQAHDTEFQRVQASPEAKTEAAHLSRVVPEDVLKQIYERIDQCWINFKDATASLAPEEIDLAMNAAIRCWCREANRIKRLTGTLPTDGGIDLAEGWQRWDCEAKIKAGI
jgi:hypothetical protein